MNLSSNIRVAINFTQSTVFAGEDVECIVTFKNVAQPSNHDPASHAPVPSREPLTPKSRKPPTQRRLSGSIQNQVKKGNRSSAPQASPISPPLRDPISPDESQSTQSRRPGHGRSLSIISLTSENSGGHDQTNQDEQVPPRRSSRGHTRSTSLQTHPRKPPSGSFTTTHGQLHSKSHSQKYNKSESPSIILQEPPLPHRSKRSNTARADIANHNNSNVPQKSSTLLRQEFKFPSSSSSNTPDGDVELHEPDTVLSPTSQPPLRQASPRIFDSSHIPHDSLNPVTRIIAGTSVNGGTPRSSIDLYSMSNHSDETLASEYPTQPVVRQSVRNPQFRLSSKLSSVEEQSGPETLMMGYAQVSGSFVLDGSLVNQGPFQEVKRKGVLGGQGGGGVVGVDRKKRDSGLFGAFGWGNIGESIGGLLGGGELSSIKEMRTIANSRAIPLLSTPQSILFVDLQLKPGESRRYSFKFTLPKGLPPSHKGRAIKVSYNITIGIQRPGSSNEQRIRSIDVPFRVFGAVNSRGDVLAHDLLTPHIYLRDTAQSLALDTSPAPKPKSESDLPSFLNYVTALLEQQSSNTGLLSPTTPMSPHLRRTSSIAEPANSKEAIDFAILRSKQSLTKQNFSTRFSIARSSRPVATILLSRTAYRLGETIHLVIDFTSNSTTTTSSSSSSTTHQLPTNPSSTRPLDHHHRPSAAVAAAAEEDHIPVYAVTVTLETLETIDAAIAMRSPQSISRYTRKIHAQFAESAHFARRLAAGLAIPPSATPEFATSGVGLEWRVRVEFVTPRLRAFEKRLASVEKDGDDAGPGDDDDGGGDDEDDDDEGGEEGKGERGQLVKKDEVGKEKLEEELDWPEKEWTSLLEEVAADDRGSVFHGVENLPVETFEVSIPVRVYGAVIGGKGEWDKGDLVI